MISKTFCKDPWTTLFIGPANEVKTCCAGNTILGDLTKNSIEEILADNPANEIKRTILNGEWHPNCQQCQKLESQNAKSYRTPVCSDELANAISINPLQFIPKLLDIRWSNICQLACNYCNEYFSSTWANLKKINIGTVREHYTDTLAWVKKYKDSVTELMLVGGEPLITKPNVDLLEIFKDCPIHISVITSLAVDLDKSPVFDQLKKYNSVSVGISFDNVGDRYNYVRHNSSWDLIVSNIEQLNQMDNIVLNTNPIYSIYNATDLVNFYTFLSQYKFNGVWWARVHYPTQLDVSTFSPEVKQLAIEEIDRLLEKFSDFKNGDLDFFRNMKQYLSTSSANPNATQNFIAFTNNLENNLLTNKQHSFFELWPELNFIKDKQ